MTLRQPRAMAGLAQELPLVSLRTAICSEVWGAGMWGRPRTRSLETLGDTKAGQGPCGVKKVLHAGSDYQSIGRNSKV